jgi:hypothetical protein
MKRSVAMALCALAATGTACSPALTPLVTRNDHRTSPITSTDSHPATAKAAFPSPTPGVDLHSATAVAIAEVEATWTVDTTVDAGWYAGELAASAYMTPSYAASIRHHPPIGAPGAMWGVWAAHRATTTVSARIEADPGGPIDTAFTAYRKVVGTVTPHGTVSRNSTVSVSSTVSLNNTASVSSAASLDGGAAPNGATTRDGTDPWVGQAVVWVTYLVVSRSSLAAPWQVAMTETTQ